MGSLPIIHSINSCIERGGGAGEKNGVQGDPGLWVLMCELDVGLPEVVEVSWQRSELLWPGDRRV